MKIITILIDPQGNSTIEVHGKSGRGCVHDTEAFERALGKVQQRQFKPDYHRLPNNVSQTQSLGTHQEAS